MENTLIQINDVPASSDSLGMDTRFKGIANFIQNCSTPMTIALQGDWGTGKTSAMKLIRNELSKNLGGKDADDFSIWFNTWQFSIFHDGDKLIIDLMQMMLHHLKKLAEKSGIACKETQKHLFTSFNDTVDCLGKVIGQVGKSAVKQLIPGSEMVFDSLEVFEKGNEHAVNSDNIPVTTYITQLCDKMNTLIKDILSTADLNHIYVFVDDLDRLEPRVALELLEGMKNFTDYENCVFVLAVDQDVVDRGLKSKYGEDFNQDKARKFFDKIIQIPFALPVQAYDIKSYVKPMLEDGDEFLQQYVNLLTKFDVRNPRTIKRSFNLLQLYKCIELARSADTNITITAEMLLKRYAILLLQLEMPDIHETMTHAAISCETQEMYREFIELIHTDEDENAALSNRLTAVLQIFYGDDFDPAAETADVSKTEELGKILKETQEMMVPLEEHQERQRLPYAELLKTLCREIKDRIWTVENLDDWNKILMTGKEKLADDTASFEISGSGENDVSFTIRWNQRKPSPNLTVYTRLDPNTMFDGLNGCFYNIKTEKDKQTYGALGYYYYDGDHPRITVVLTAGKNTLDYTLRFLSNCGILSDSE